MPTDNIDSKYLKDTVADVLIRACSECAVARPKDPVDYVAGWLARYVEIGYPVVAAEFWIDQLF